MSTITHLGTVLDWLQWPRSLLLIVVPGLLLVVSGWRDRVRRGAAVVASSAAS